mgnify:CR=1 FL=1
MVIDGFNGEAWALAGPPALTVLAARLGAFGDPPDLVVSGINKGWNLGDDVTYSGTVSGALEGALLGVPSIAVSLQRTRERLDFSHAAKAAATIARRVLPSRLALNRRAGSGSEAPLAKVSFTTCL